MRQVPVPLCLSVLCISVVFAICLGVEYLAQRYNFSFKPQRKDGKKCSQCSQSSQSSPELIWESLGVVDEVTVLVLFLYLMKQFERGVWVTNMTDILSILGEEGELGKGIYKYPYPKGVLR